MTNPTDKAGTVSPGDQFSSEPGDLRRKLEIAAVFLTGIGKFVFMDTLQWRLPFILSAVVAWTVYIIVRTKTTPGILLHWGFRLDNFGKVARMVLPFGISAVAAFLAIGLYRGTANMTLNMLPVLVVYPIWGTIQQFLVIGLVAGNMRDIASHRLGNAPIIIVTALLFGLLHYPSLWLMIGTFVLALFYGWIYLKERNVYVMGLFHGWLGALFFYTVVDRDPFVEVFGRVLN